MESVRTRRSFCLAGGMALAGLSALGSGSRSQSRIRGFEETQSNTDAKSVWHPVAERRIRLGIVGYGVCRFGTAFDLQHHPNVEVVAVSDLFPERCRELALECRCDKTYPSMEELLRDKDVEAVFVATDAPSHGRLCIEALEHGKHVACAVPAVFGSLDEAEHLYQTVRKTGLTYMMFETTVFRNDCYAMREVYRAGGFGRMVYSEGEYYHFMEVPIDSFQGWRVGLPPQWYPTHSNGYYSGVTGGSFQEVSCMGLPSAIPHLQPANNSYGNPFGTEIALFRTSEGGMARMAVSWDTPGYDGEIGRVRGQKGSMTGTAFEGTSDISQVALTKPPLPPGVTPGGHGGSHGYLAEEFVTAILLERRPLVDISLALNMTVAGIVAHQSALKDGELLKIPQFAPVGEA